MAHKALSIPHEDIQTGEAVTQRTDAEFRKHGLDIHVNEVDTVDDDFKTKTRHITVKTTKYFIMPECPWKKKS